MQAPHRVRSGKFPTAVQTQPHGELSDTGRGLTPPNNQFTPEKVAIGSLTFAQVHWAANLCSCGRELAVARQKKYDLSVFVQIDDHLRSIDCSLPRCMTVKARSWPVQLHTPESDTGNRYTQMQYVINLTVSHVKSRVKLSHGTTFVVLQRCGDQPRYPTNSLPYKWVKAAGDGPTLGRLISVPLAGPGRCRVAQLSAMFCFISKFTIGQLTR